MTRLSVNVNKIATLRNARGGNLPDVVQVAQSIESYGAQGITIHPRPDERHIKRQDVYDLKKVVKTEFNIEGYPSEDFITMVLEVKPEQVTLVPDPPDVLTSNAGWNTVKESSFLQETISRFKEAGIRTSIFIEVDLRMIESARATGTDRIELYTEDYVKKHQTDCAKAIEPYVKAAILANEMGLGLNAGHDLNLHNLKFFREKIPSLLEVSIGHALISDALYLGLEETVKRYLGELA